MENIEELTENIERFLGYTNQETNFSGPSEYLYSRINEFHKKKSLTALLDDEIFYDYIYATLASWGMHRMGTRGAKMQEFTLFKESILNCKSELLSLDKLALETLQQNQIEQVKTTLSVIFDKLNIMQTKSKIVGISKTLHFILPNLIVPIDREYTLWFFGIKNLKDLEYEKEIFIRLFDEFVKISQKLKLDKVEFERNQFQPSAAKLIDNAIIGYKLSKR